MRLFLLIVGCLLAPTAAAAGALSYAVAAAPTPVYNNPQIAAHTEAPPTDRCGQVRELEFIAFAGTPFTIVAESVHQQQTVFEVISEAYRPPPGARLFVSAASLDRVAQPPPVRRPSEHRPSELLQRLRSAVGLPYVWGGNLRQGVMGGESRIYAGLDCSGLLYEATDGRTPRNTADLVSYGRAVPVAGLDLEQVLERLQPLDLIVWKGHVVIVADRGEAIESVLHCGQPGNGGVRLTPLRQRLHKIMAARRSADSWPDSGTNQHVFVVRRWLP